MQLCVLKQVNIFTRVTLSTLLGSFVTAFFIFTYQPINQIMVLPQSKMLHMYRSGTNNLVGHQLYIFSFLNRACMSTIIYILHNPVHSSRLTQPMTGLLHMVQLLFLPQAIRSSIDKCWNSKPMTLVIYIAHCYVVLHTYQLQDFIRTGSGLQLHTVQVMNLERPGINNVCTEYNAN